MDSMAPGSELQRAGVEPVGRMSYELANGSVHEYPFGLAQIEFMGEVTAGRVIFGPDETEPILERPPQDTTRASITFFRSTASATGTW